MCLLNELKEKALLRNWTVNLGKEFLIASQVGAELRQSWQTSWIAVCFAKQDVIRLLDWENLYSLWLNLGRCIGNQCDQSNWDTLFTYLTRRQICYCFCSRQRTEMSESLRGLATYSICFQESQDL